MTESILFGESDFDEPITRADLLAAAERINRRTRHRRLAGRLDAWLIQRASDRVGRSFSPAQSATSHQPLREIALGEGTTGPRRRGAVPADGVLDGNEEMTLIGVDASDYLGTIGSESPNLKHAAKYKFRLAAAALVALAVAGLAYSVFALRSDSAMTLVVAAVAVVVLVSSTAMVVSQLKDVALEAEIRRHARLQREINEQWRAIQTELAERQVGRESAPTESPEAEGNRLRRRDSL